MNNRLKLDDLRPNGARFDIELFAGLGGTLVEDMQFGIDRGYTFGLIFRKYIYPFPNTPRFGLYQAVTAEHHYTKVGKPGSYSSPKRRG